MNEFETRDLKFIVSKKAPAQKVFSTANYWPVADLLLARYCEFKCHDILP